jgi:hypothetical protein
MQPDTGNVRIVVSPTITSDQLFAFYVENNICEKGFLARMSRLAFSTTAI